MALGSEKYKFAMMMYGYRRLVFVLTGIFFSCLAVFAQQDHPRPGRVPRLYLRAGDEKALMANIAKDDIWSRMHAAIIEECAVIDTLPLCERVIKGPRMHAVSCEVLRRVLFLSYAYRMEGLEKCAARAEKELLHAAAFVDWNPPHFLDVAEMSTAFFISWVSTYPYVSPCIRRDRTQASSSAEPI